MEIREEAYYKELVSRRVAPGLGGEADAASPFGGSSALATSIELADSISADEDAPPSSSARQQQQHQHAAPQQHPPQFRAAEHYRTANIAVSTGNATGSFGGGSSIYEDTQDDHDADAAANAPLLLRDAEDSGGGGMELANDPGCRQQQRRGGGYQPPGAPSAGGSGAGRAPASSASAPAAAPFLSQLSSGFGEAPPAASIAEIVAHVLAAHSLLAPCHARVDDRLTPRMKLALVALAPALAVLLAFTFSRLRFAIVEWALDAALAFALCALAREALLRVGAADPELHDYECGVDGVAWSGPTPCGPLWPMPALGALGAVVVVDTVLLASADADAAHRALGLASAVVVLGLGVGEGLARAAMFYMRCWPSWLAPPDGAGSAALTEALVDGPEEDDGEDQTEYV